MLSYQHGYHAGNFADVHKHTALCLVLKVLGANPSLATYIDTHAGRGLYRLGDEQSQKTKEYESGIKRFLASNPQSEALKLYQETIAQFEKGVYPGSPAIMQKYMADNHRGLFFEFHPKEHEELKQNMAGDKRIRAVYQDVMKALINFLPQRKAPGLVLIDPSFELKEEYETIARLANQTHKRWPAATIMIWYPLLPEGRHELLKAGLKDTTIYELIGPAKERGMYGTGLGVINPPEGFHESFAACQQEMKDIIFP